MVKPEDPDLLPLSEPRIRRISALHSLAFKTFEHVEDLMMRAKSSNYSSYTPDDTRHQCTGAVPLVQLPVSNHSMQTAIYDKGSCTHQESMERQIRQNTQNCKFRCVQNMFPVAMPHNHKDDTDTKRFDPRSDRVNINTSKVTVDSDVCTNVLVAKPCVWGTSNTAQFNQPIMNGKGFPWSLSQYVSSEGVGQQAGVSQEYSLHPMYNNTRTASDEYGILNHLSVSCSSSPLSFRLLARPYRDGMSCVLETMRVCAWLSYTGNSRIIELTKNDLSRRQMCDDASYNLTHMQDYATWAGLNGTASVLHLFASDYMQKTIERASATLVALGTLAGVSLVASSTPTTSDSLYKHVIPNELFAFLSSKLTAYDALDKVFACCKQMPVSTTCNPVASMCCGLTHISKTFVEFLVDIRQHNVRVVGHLTSDHLDPSDTNSPRVVKAERSDCASVRVANGIAYKARYGPHASVDDLTRTAIVACLCPLSLFPRPSSRNVPQSKLNTCPSELVVVDDETNVRKYLTEFVNVAAGSDISDLASVQLKIAQSFDGLDQTIRSSVQQARSAQTDTIARGCHVNGSTPCHLFDDARDMQTVNESLAGPTSDRPTTTKRALRRVNLPVATGQDGSYISSAAELMCQKSGSSWDLFLQHAPDTVVNVSVLLTLGSILHYIRVTLPGIHQMHRQQMPCEEAFDSTTLQTVNEPQKQSENERVFRYIVSRKEWAQFTAPVHSNDDRSVFTPTSYESLFTDELFDAALDIFSKHALTKDPSDFVNMHARQLSVLHSDNWRCVNTDGSPRIQKGWDGSELAESFTQVVSIVHASRKSLCFLPLQISTKFASSVNVPAHTTGHARFNMFHGNTPKASQTSHAVYFGNQSSRSRGVQAVPADTPTTAHNVPPVITRVYPSIRCNDGNNDNCCNMRVPFPMPGHTSYACFDRLNAGRLTQDGIPQRTYNIELNSVQWVHALMGGFTSQLVVEAGDCTLGNHCSDADPSTISMYLNETVSMDALKTLLETSLHNPHISKDGAVLAVKRQNQVDGTHVPGHANGDDIVVTLGMNTTDTSL
jgi:hypothetical protein